MLTFSSFSSLEENVSVGTPYSVYDRKYYAHKYTSKTKFFIPVTW